MTRFIHHYDVVHEWGHSPASSIWHIVGIILGVIILLALIGIIINCWRNSQVGAYGYGGYPGQVQTVVYWLIAKYRYFIISILYSNFLQIKLFCDVSLANVVVVYWLLHNTTSVSQKICYILIRGWGSHNNLLRTKTKVDFVWNSINLKSLLRRWLSFEDKVLYFYILAQITKI